MTDRLVELAALWGVETIQRAKYDLIFGDISAERPRLDIAHDLLAKLPEWYSVRYNGHHKIWTAEVGNTPHTIKITGHDTFESAVIALAERAGVKP